MSETVLVALIAFGGTLAGSVAGVLAANRLTGHRLDRLEGKVDLHNHAMERLAAVEVTLKTRETSCAREMGRIYDRITELRKS